MKDEVKSRLAEVLQGGFFLNLEVCGVIDARAFGSRD